MLGKLIPLWVIGLVILGIGLGVAYFIEVMRMIVLKGSGFQDIRQQFSAMGGFALAFNGLAIWNYRKRN